MTPDVMRLIEFYRSPLGNAVRPLIREEVLDLAGDVRGQRVLGLGFATPYLRSMLKPAERVMAFMPARQGSSSWPREGPSRTVLCDPLEMPLTDSAVDLIVAVHAFEHASDAEELMREIWRVSAANARLIVVVPKRRGLWSQRDNTPFGSGHPYSRGQLDQLLRDHSFTPEACRECVYLPPFDNAMMLKSAGIFERGARLIGPALAGIMVMKAKKELVPAIARRQRAERFVRLPDLTPQTAMVAPPRHS
jgi:SAM-dependent methyltransferase